jgi:outer membrane receptor protein involved in Fe transport
MISGKLIEKGSNVALEYASVAIYLVKDSSLVSGGISGADGRFSVGNLASGDYYLKAQFIGYNTYVYSDIELQKGKMKVDLGDIKLESSSKSIDEVTVVAQDRPISYNIDKKIVDPSQFPTAANGTALDILSNTPSVSVDIEGNVTMRGSSNFKVLIDGRPTPFDPDEALQQVPSSSIQNIEIITNPSAKYDPDGSSGIVNIITKKSKMRGFSGIVNATGDTNGSITGDALLNYRVGKFNFYVSGNRSERVHGGTTTKESMTISSDTVFTNSYGDTEYSRTSTSFKSGIDYSVNDYNALSFNVSFNDKKQKKSSDLDYYKATSAGYESNTFTNNYSDNNGTSWAYSFDYKKTFKQKGRELTALMYYKTGDSQENSTYRENSITGDTLIEGQYSWEDGDNKEFRLQVDYVHPFNEHTKLETGLQSRIDKDDEWNDVDWFYTETSNASASETSPYYSLTNFKRDIYSGYFMFSQQRNLWGYQLGLRGEYTNRKVDYSNVDDVYKINRLDLFPTLHLSFELPSKQQVSASYSRRIDRPRGYQLEPFVTYSDAYNVRQGNPDIKPEYVNSYEFGYQKTLTNGFLSVELYHRQTNNVINRVESSAEEYGDDVIMQTVENIGKDYSTGLELMLNCNPTKWWVLNLMGNAYHYQLKGELEDEDVDTHSFNWDSRLNNTFLLGENTKLQVDGMYHSPTVTAQGRREGFMFTNLALRHDFLNKKLTTTIGVRDVLNTAKFEMTSEGSDFYTHREFDMDSPIISFTVSYRINNYKQRQRKSHDSDSDSINMDGSDM